jgi:hypothetical protein
VAHRVDLGGLAFAVVAEPHVFPEGFSADAVTRRPEVRSAALVGHVGDHAPDLARLDLPERVAAELEVVALLVDRVRAHAVDQDAVVNARDQVVERHAILRRLEPNVGHSLEGAPSRRRLPG